MSRRTKIIIIVVLVLLFLLGVLLMLLLRPGARPAQQNANIPPNLNSSVNASAGLNVTSSTDVNRPPLADQVAPPPAPAAQTAPTPAANLQRIAMAFAERFGSYSNQSGYQNIDDLKAFMSAKMITWADSYVASAQQSQGTSGSTQYSGITTRAISATVDHLDAAAGTATVTVNTQRQKRQGLSFSSDIYYQSLVLTFVKENDSWKVDSATWQGQQQ